MGFFPQPGKASEEDAASFAADLSKVDSCRRRIGHEAEAMPGAHWRGGRDGDGDIPDLEEVSGKFIHCVAEAHKAVGHVAPLDIHRIDVSARVSQRAVETKAVRNRESVKHRADVVGFEAGGAAGQIDLASAVRQLSRPED